ncbi:hypothetical protein [Streptomyces sp. ISL-100]|uniref:hypothetical protein n=1 Tax=Streptomyces sp. ISL-100 TaxID=2819173 RepID=UPI001BEA2431|nr:hypothetical protein [Streptomyces sp. ISL-100]MBT2400862.1 hypothetical protein [Streptomyces sp. ISL-100]
MTEALKGSTARNPSAATVAISQMHGMAFAALAACLCAVLSAFLYVGSMCYTLANYREWHEVVAFVVSLVFGVIALLSVTAHLIGEASITTYLMPRAGMWLTCLVLAGLQLTAAVLGDAHFSMSAVIGLTTVLAVAGFGELAGHAVSESVA